MISSKDRQQVPGGERAPPDAKVPKKRHTWLPSRYEYFIFLRIRLETFQRCYVAFIFSTKISHVLCEGD